MKAYIAAPFAEFKLVNLIASQLHVLYGIEFTNRWSQPDFQHATMSDKEAVMDLADIDAADVLLFLNDASWDGEGMTKGSGGRHVEFGYALAKGKPIVLVGPQRNVFHFHSNIYLVPWSDLRSVPFSILIEALEHVCKPV